jgi:hypothetical protein
MTDSPTSAFDLDAYLARIGHAGPREPGLPLLQALHLRHAWPSPSRTWIPVEPNKGMKSFIGARESGCYRKA